MALPEAPVTGTLPFQPPEQFPPDLREFWLLWRQERFWACHEALEEVWRAQSGPRRHFLNGLIHGAVAVFQHRRGNPAGAARQLRRAQVKLESFRPQSEGLDVDGFLQGVEREIASSLEKLTEKQRAALNDVEAAVRKRMSTSG